MSINFSKSFVIVTALAGLLPTTGCIDDSYDLDDIDTDMEFKVNDLVVPLKLDAITLSNVFDLDPESTLKEIDGQYAILVDGTIESAATHVSASVITPNDIEPIRCDIFKYEGTDIDLPVAAQSISYEITEATTDFSFSTHDIDRTINAVENIKVNWDIKVKLDLENNNGLFSVLSFKNLHLVIPEGFHISNYPCQNGHVEVGNLDMNISAPTFVTLHVDMIDFTKFDSDTFTFEPSDGSANNGYMAFDGKVGVVSGYVVGATNSFSAVIPQNVELQVDPIMNTIDILSVTGTISYKLNDFSVADVTIDDLPEMLKRPGTNIALANPQLYASLNNPMAYYNLTAASGLTITAMKGNADVNICSLDKGEELLLDYSKGMAGPYNFCMAPTDPATYYGDYTGAKFVGYKSLSNLLSGQGLPDKIRVNFDNPRVLPGRVVDFPLDHDIDGISGKYSLYAPLELTAGSTVFYEEDETGWNDDDTFDKITITSLKVTATAYNSLPADIVLSGTLLDNDGKPLLDKATGKPVKLNGFTVGAESTATIELTTEGTISGLDGIIYTAQCDVTKDGNTLKPSSPISLTDIRVTVSGSYRDTF